MNWTRYFVLALCLQPAAGAVRAAEPVLPPDLTVAVRAAPHVPTASAYAQVVPVRALTLRAQISGTVEAVRVMPGETVGEQSLLMRVSGPQANAELHSARADRKSATAAFTLAKKKLHIDQAMPSDFVTRIQLREDETALVQARANLQAARASLAFMLAATEVRVPVAGTVLSVAVADGAHVLPGNALATIQQASGLWLRATFYAEAAGRLRAGLHGVYQPQDGHPAVAVQVQSVIAPVTADGGVAVGCIAANADAGWRNGEAGTLRIRLGNPGVLPEVPNSALVMDRGHWWVLLADAHGLHRQKVAIGASTGEWTSIVHGVRAGEQVVAMNAYLLFHADISQHYAPSD